MPNPESLVENIESRESVKVAALDIGSNSFHLVVARIMAGSVQILHRVKQRVRLAEGLDKNNILSDEAIARGVNTLRLISDSLKGFEPDSVKVVATHTLRKAKNAKAFILAAEKVFPYPIEIISGNEEARLIYNGVAHNHHFEGRRMVIDIGGGSTEFIIGEQFDAKLLRSLQMGCVSYTKRFFPTGEIKKKAFTRAITAAQQELELIDKRYCKLGWDLCLGTSGTIKAIALLVQEVRNKPIGWQFTRDDVQHLIDTCCQAGHSDKLLFESLSDERRPVLAAGLAILMAAFESLNISAIEYNAAALREGVIYEMEARLTRPDIRERTAESLATRYDVDTEHASRVFKTAMHLFEHCADTWKINKPEIRSLLGWSAWLHEVGLQINSKGVQRHSGYVLQNVDMPGFNQEQQTLLAALVRFHRKKIRTNEIPGLTLFSESCVHRMMAILRLAVLLNIKRQDDFLPEYDVEVVPDGIKLAFPAQWLKGRPIFNADLQREIDQIAATGISLQVK